MLFRCAQTDTMPLCSPLPAIKGYPQHEKWRIPIFRHRCLNSLIILSWLYLGFNRKLYKCVPHGLRKSFVKVEVFLHIAQYRMKNPDENACEQNKWSDGCPRRRRKQKWHDGEKTFISAMMVGGKAAISKRIHRMERFGFCEFFSKVRWDTFV